MKDINIDHTLKNSDGIGKGVILKKPAELIGKYVVDDDFMFQRIYTFSDGTVLIDEVAKGTQYIRSTHPLAISHDEKIIVNNV